MKNMKSVISALSMLFVLPAMLTGCLCKYEHGSGIGRSDIVTLDKNAETDIDGNPVAATDTSAQTTAAETDLYTNSSSLTDDIRFSFVAAGDNIIHESVFVDAKNRASFAASTGAYFGKYYFEEMYVGIKSLIASASIAYVNQEGPVAGDSLGIYGYPTFNAPEEIGDALINTGFDIVNLANNHMLDMDNTTRTGYKHTIDYWKTKNIMTVGAYESEEDYDTIRVYEKDGIKIALLSYTYGVNDNKLSPQIPDLVVPYIDDTTIKKHITAAKKQADLVFVSMHWGTDTAGASFNNKPTSEQKRLAQFIADLGADVIIGMHPHVIQPMTYLTGSGGHKTLVAYSIGNLLSTMLNSYNNVGGLLSFDIVKDTDGAIYVDAPVFFPVVCHYNADPTVIDSQGYATRFALSLYLLEDYTSTLAANHGSQLYGAFTLDTLYGYVRDTIDPRFLPSYIG